MPNWLRERLESTSDIPQPALPRNNYSPPSCHALRGMKAVDAPRPARRRALPETFPRRTWERGGE